MPQHSRNSAARAIFTAVLVAGTLDILAAFTHFYIVRGTNPAPIVLKYIASGVFGADAMKGGTGMMLMGLLFHYLIVLGCVLVFFILYPRLRIMRVNKWITGVVYGCVVWAVTNLVIVPLSLVKRGPMHLDAALIAIAILVLMIGLPITFLLGGHLDRRHPHRAP